MLLKKTIPYLVIIAIFAIPTALIRWCILKLLGGNLPTNEFEWLLVTYLAPFFLACLFLFLFILVATFLAFKLMKSPLEGPPSWIEDYPKAHSKFDDLNDPKKLKRLMQEPRTQENLKKIRRWR